MFNFEWLRNFYPPDVILSSLQTEYLNILSFSVDGWLLIHFLSGLVLGWFLKNVSTKKIILGLILFEVFENFILYPQGLTQYEPFLNMVLDVFIAYLGITLIRLNK